MSHVCLATRACLAQCPPHATKIVYDAWDVDEGDISLPRAMSEDLVNLRREHAAWAFDTGFAETGHGRVAELLKQGSSLSAWWCSTLYERHPKVTPALYPLHLLRTAEKLLVGLNADSVEVRGLDKTCTRVMQALCRARGWRFSEGDIAADRPVRGLRRVYEKTPAPLRALVRFAVWLWQVKRLLPRTTLAGAPVQSATIATYYPNIDTSLAGKGIFRSRYWESLHDALGEDRSLPVRWLFVRFPSPQGSLDQCVAWERHFAKTGASGVSFNYLEEFLGAKDMARACLRWLRVCLQSLRIQHAVAGQFRYPDSKLDFWPLLRADYVESFRGWRSLERCLQKLGIDNYVSAAGPQRWYTFPLENCPWERMLTQAVHERGFGPVYGAQHSTIRPTDFRYFDDPATWENVETAPFQPDKIAGNGESACSQWREARVPQSRLTMVEALRYLYLTRDRGSATTFGDTVLLVTSFFADETRAHIRLLADCLKQGVLDAQKVRIKPHPYLPVDSLLGEYLGSAPRPVITSAPLPEEYAAHPVVWASNSTTAALEAALMGLPVLVMQPAGDFDLCPLQNVPGLQRTWDVASVRTALHNLAPLAVADDYLCLDETLSRWRALLGLGTGEGTGNRFL